MGSLFEYVGDYKMLQELIDNEDVTYEQVAEALGVIEGNIEQKVENISWLIREYSAKAEMFKAEEYRLNKRRKTYDNKIDGLKKYLLDSLTELKKTKIEAGTLTVRKQKNPQSVSIKDESLIPKEYLIEQPYKIDSKSIKEALKEGKIVSGAEYAPDSYHIRIG